MSDVEETCFADILLAILSSHGNLLDMCRGGGARPRRTMQDVEGSAAAVEGSVVVERWLLEDAIDFESRQHDAPPSLVLERMDHLALTL